MWVEARRRGESVVRAVADGRENGTVGELAAALGLDPAEQFSVDGQLVDGSVPLDESPVVNGSVVAEAHGGPTMRSPNQGAGVELAVVAGPDAGQVRRLASEDAVVVGRDGSCDLVLDSPTVSARHAIVRFADDIVTVEDLESRNGTWVKFGPDAEDALDARTAMELPTTLRLGSVHLAIRPVIHEDRPTGVHPVHAGRDGRVLLNRPPREAVPAPADPVRVPTGKPERANPFFSPIALVAPILFGAVMVLVLGSWRYALFAVLSPLMLLSGWLTNRRRVAKQRRDDDLAFGDGIERFRRDLAHAAERERARRIVVAPDLAEVIRRMALPSGRLWERRLADADALQVGLGTGAAAWSPALDRTSSPGVPAGVDEVLAEFDVLDDARLLADLQLGPLGVVGDAGLADGLVRSVVLQLCSAHGPADLSVLVVAADNRIDAWSWAQWLPHVRDGAGGVRIVEPRVAALVAEALDETLERGEDHRWLIVIDDASLVHDRESVLRRLLAATDRGVLGVVAAETSGELPAAIATVAELATSDGRMDVRRPAGLPRLESGVVDAVGADTALEACRAAARWDDPELRLRGAGVPPLVEAADLFGPVPTQEALASRWRSVGDGTRLRALIGEGSDGPFEIDLVADGPHALVAGTTGAGKSELLRSWLLGLAHRAGPTELVMVLIDYKGGAAFDALRSLPHVVGVVTDLDEHLAERALRSLEAELHHRESVLAAAEVSDLVGHRAAGSPGGVLPRLVVVIDEFATLRTELPEFVTALVGVAQRGRSLGVHLVLATQRPAGAVDANIRANTNLRVALRVQTEADSSDVIGGPGAAHLPASTPGRALVSIGGSDVTTVQTALSSVPPRQRRQGVSTVPITLGRGAPPEIPAPDRSSTATVLESTVEVMRRAAARLPAPRRPWLPDLPSRLGVAAFEAVAGSAGHEVPLAVGDDPDRQRRLVLGWSPAQGPLVVLGALGSGVSTTLGSLVARLQHGIDGRPVWVFGADHGDGSLRSVAARPHVSCVLGRGDDAAHRRLLDLLEDLLDERAAGSADGPLAVVVVDGIGGFLDLLDAGAGGANADRLARVLRDGPPLGIVFAVGAGRPAEVPRSLLAMARQRIVHELADPADLGVLGIRRRTLPRFGPGRALVGADEMVAQVVDQRDLAGPDPADPPPQVAPLAASVELQTLPAPSPDASGLLLPIALEVRSHRPAELRLRTGEHALVAGPPQSGRTTTLLTIARQVRSLDERIVLVGVVADGGDLIAHGADGPFDAGGTLDELRPVLERAEHEDGRRWVIVVDDVERVGEHDGVERLVRSGRPDLHVVAAVRTNSSRSDWPRWMRVVRSSGNGVLLNADPLMDGELLSVRLPRGVRSELPGRGWVVQSGIASESQIAR